MLKKLQEITIPHWLKCLDYDRVFLRIYTFEIHGFTLLDLVYY